LFHRSDFSDEMMIARRVVLFDLGGVLIESTGQDALRRLCADKWTSEEILHKWLWSPSVVRFESGKVSPQIFARSFLEEWQLDLDPASFLDMFASWPRQFFGGAASLVQAVRARHTVGCLSNINEVHWTRFPEIPSWFDVVFASHLTGFVKPDPEAYRHALNTLGVNPDHVTFLDDLQPNVEAAQALGMRALRIRGFADIEPVLRNEGIL
jgi:putative hydrolase of the HAD superfamily